PRRRLAASAVALARLASHLGGLLDALGSLAGTQARDLRAGVLGFLQTGAQCLHEIDDLAFALRGDFGNRDFLALDLLLDRRFDAPAQLVLVGVRIELLGGLLIDELL